MPYINKRSRKVYDPHITKICDELAQGDFNPGDVNYIFTRIIIHVWKRFPRYRTIAEVTGVLENVKQEFYRRWATPYENKKIKENGDVK
jgi:hypothetical protein